MHIEIFREYCLHKRGVTEETPFGEFTLVYKVMGKMFALADMNSQPLSFNVKCEPEKALQLREEYAAVQPGYHMNKRHWNTVLADGSVPDDQLREWIDDSYRLVAASLTNLQKQALAALKLGDPEDFG